MNTKIFLDSKPLIPRTETEYWVNEVISKLDKNRPLQVLDLCAGSGAIGIAIATELPLAHIDFVEIDEIHHETIRKNAFKNGIEPSRYRVLGGNLFENVRGKYELIISNPPYIDASLNRVSRDVLDHEPALALFGGSKGLEVIDRILAQAEAHLSPGGTLWLEHEPEQTRHLAEHPLYKGTYPDQYGVERYSRFQLAKQG